MRADGGSQIGMGHIMRTLTLAKNLRKNNDVFYVCRVDIPLTNKYSMGIKKIKEEGFNVVIINEENTISELNNIKADLLITDSYDVDERYFFETKKIFKNTVYIDDLNLFYFDVDILINPNITAVDFQYQVPNDTRLLLGTKYLMLREEFRVEKAKEDREEIKDIMITVGGGDPLNITNKILEYIIDLKINYHVVIGPAFDVEVIKKIESICKGRKNIKLYKNSNIVDVMKKCDLAISACGSTIYELCAINIPILGIILADNQYKIGTKMHEKDLIYCLGWYYELKKENIIGGINYYSDIKVRKKTRNDQSKIININGVEEVSKEIMNLCR
ncbi:UDP-2,4-diacetamido-2,4,6-trideoxy-beta-L-altropyranose hydrolase [Clostridium paridis]|uniref:UDP-2,4-diacetamido-2,4, 6-trideoxy-beta-L-altropyranose hydrolase n=1 Tax=Clostridium paridis TaxID=2803863 RepID=UPI0030844465